MIDMEGIYQYFKTCQSKRYATSPHLETLRTLAKECEDIVELGVLRGGSTAAFLLGAAGNVYGYDIKQHPAAIKLQSIADGKFIYTIQDTLANDCKVPECDMIFFDSLHTYRQLQGELIKHGNRAKKYLLFHDTITFGIQGADGETGRVMEGFERGVFNAKVHGIRLAIDEYMMLHPEWKIKWHHPHSHGLLCLEKR